ncbi:hypothetical protein BU24DRAFT_352894 [Aaosphaeria arxii CBS 175.79]|uniref:Uncharacterized protein n=1 Tax=Aaosphaeria arxii CBS 175.79 TaxID=1450172 RepID=A0A6A5XGP5_9PLEO|nr:uncharacterized protein BU24DRAFT_352894 [Aaosphaeria arxii CBS 175.79]KAF2012358.1 hypothetical protein BU24DRAFT_352894 [Aaosphaeria arxii CBS 175.79]
MAAARAQATTAAHNSPLAPSRPRTLTSTYTLPNGPCTHRDLAFGSCGCNQFWDVSNADVHVGSTGQGASNERSTYCVCGHHACFHLQTPRIDDALDTHMAEAQNLNSIERDGPNYIMRPSSQTDHVQQGMLNHMVGPLIQSADPLHTRDEQPTAPPLDVSGLPRVPSVCLLSHERRERHARANNIGRLVSDDTSQARRDFAGLGLSLSNLGNEQHATDLHLSTLPTLPMPAPVVLNAPESIDEPEISPSTRANSVLDPNSSTGNPTGHPTGRPNPWPLLPSIDVGGDTIPDTYNPDEFIQSATEVATPSAANTPDLGIADQAVHEGKRFVETLAKLMPNTEQRNVADLKQDNSASVQVATKFPSNSPIHAQLQHALRTGSPQTLQKIAAYLAPLHNLLNSMPNVANAMRDLTNRLDYLENNSFNHVQPDDFHTTMDLYDGRLLELEHRMDDHDKMHQTIDTEQGSGSFPRRNITSVTESFGSNNSFCSTTSSAMILAAMDRKGMESELGEIKERLDILEAAAQPTMSNSWEVEVVLLPWGTELHGIWFPADEPMHDPTKAITQNSEEWTQAIASVHGQRVDNSQSMVDPSTTTSDGQVIPSNFPSSQESNAWDAQAITEWATGPADEWLFPKACGSNNLVYKRLQSRGFIKNVTLTSSNSKDIQAALTTAFRDLVELLEYDGQDNSIVSLHPGLLATFIPLRKVVKSSRLEFLAPSEMSTSALWSTQFLAAGVMMRVSGGKKRLYVTQREAYMQHSDYEEVSWTWQQLRQLPRHQPDMDSQMEGNDEHCQPRVEEADAKEACWAYVEAYDAPPPSVNESFSSHQSAPMELSMRPAGREWRRSITPTSILKVRQQQPLSPSSGRYLTRPMQARPRTASTSVLERNLSGIQKRRLNSSPVKQHSAPQSVWRTPSVSTLRPKRRRILRSSSSPSGQVAGLGGTEDILEKDKPRPSRELPSPLSSSHPALPRTSSDITSRSQRSVAIVGRTTPFAYATPYSGPVSGGRPKFGGFDDHPGDTEPDDDDYDGNDDDDSGEDDISWDGVDDDGHSDIAATSTSGSDLHTRGLNDPASFSSDESGFGSESNQEDSDADAVDVNMRAPEGDDDNNGFGAQRQTDGEEEEDVFDALLGVLER